MNGKIKNINREKGFFFITGTDGSDYFAHRSQVLKPDTFEELEKGDPVSFEDTDSERGLRAEEVRRA